MEYQAKAISEDGTIKYILSVPLKKKNLEATIEAAFIHLPKRTDNKPEYVLCLSSSIGCPYRCLICANTMQSHLLFEKLLSPNEIEEEIDLILSQDNNYDKIKKTQKIEIAFMGIGEPLYGNNVIRAIQEHKSKVKDTRFVISSIGAQGTIDKLTNSEIQYPIRLELSLHFPNDYLRRNWIVPGLFSFDKEPVLSIENMLDEAERFYKKHKEKIALNYMLIDGLNNLDGSLIQLKNLLNKREKIFYVKVMLPSCTSSLVYSWKEKGQKTYQPEEFRQKLKDTGIQATYFKSRGSDVLAGCGMFASRYKNVKGFVHTRLPPEAKVKEMGFG
jgi:23S rRNA (adenine2503-C2)-methyltransferase